MRAAEATVTIPTPAPFDVAALFDGLAGAASVAIAVSGGSDSVALLRLCALWDEVPIVALTVDHGLRDGSADEARQVARWCAARGIEHHVLRWEGPKPTTGLQAKARQARYDLLTAFCRDNRIEAVLTGHTMDDQAETVLMRLARTESAAALAGIWPETTWNGVRVLRPLMGVKRVALRAWLRDIGQDWIDDPSNDDRRFERVRVRQAMTPADTDALAARADDARAETVVLSAEADAWIDAHVSQWPESHFTFDRVALQQVVPQVRCAVLAKLLQRAGSGVAPDAMAVQQLVGGITFGMRRTLGGALVAVRQREVIVVREAGRIPDGWAAVGPSGTMDWDRRFRVTAPPGSHVGAVRLVGGLARPSGLPFFVFLACPVVKLPDETQVLALDSACADVSARLL